MEKLNLRELKGAPLSIILAILMAGNRSVSVSWLVTETGYSDKTVNSGLDLLRSRQIITQTGRCRYQLTGENVQLPLYWGEKVERVNPSPASDQPALFELGDGVENFSLGNFSQGSGTGGQGSVGCGQGSVAGCQLPVTGVFPESGIFPGLEMRVSELEKRVGALEKRNFSEIEVSEVGISPKTGKIPENSNDCQTIFSGNSPKSGEIPDESGEIPDLININNELNKDPDKNINLFINSDESGEIPEEVLNDFEHVRKNGLICSSVSKHLLANSDVLKFRDNCITIGFYDQWNFNAFQFQNRMHDVEKELPKYKIEYIVLTKDEKELIDRRKAAEREKKRAFLERKMEEMRASYAQCEERRLSLPENADGITEENVKICNRYHDSCEGIAYSLEELQELVGMHPVPDVLRFVLPRAKSFDAAKRWAAFDLKSLKRELLIKVCNVGDPALSRIAGNDQISPFQIDYHFWNWFLRDRHENPNHRPGWYVNMIERGAEKMVAETEDPLKCEYLA